MNAQTRRQIMERLKAERPEPESELNHNNAFELLIAVMLSAQATDKSVNLATPALFAAMPDAATMAQKLPKKSSLSSRPSAYTAIKQSTPWVLQKLCSSASTVKCPKH